MTGVCAITTGVPGLGVIGAGIRAAMVARQEGFQPIPYREHPVHVLHDSKTGQLLAILLVEIDEETDRSEGQIIKSGKTFRQKLK